MDFTEALEAWVASHPQTDLGRGLIAGSDTGRANYIEDGSALSSGPGSKARSTRAPARPKPSAVFVAPERGRGPKDEHTVLAVAGDAAPRPKWLADHLQTPPFLVSILAPVKSGKTTTIVNIVLNPALYRKAWSRVYLVSPTARVDDTFAPLVADPAATAYVPASPKEFEAAIASVITAVGEGDEPSVLVVDDCVNLIGGSSVFLGLCTRYRHLKLSIIVATQYFKALPPVVRSNTSMFLVFRLTNEKELMAWLEEEAGNFPPRELEAAYRAVTKNKYHFLRVDRRELTLGDSFFNS